MENRHLFVTLVAGLLCFGRVLAEDIVTRDGKQTLKNAEVIRFNPVTASIRHSLGIVEIPLRNLPEKVQEKCGYSDEKAQQYLQQLQQSKNRATQERQIDAAALSADAKIIQVTDAGVLARITIDHKEIITNREVKIVGGGVKEYKGLNNKTVYSEALPSSKIQSDVIEVKHTPEEWEEPVFIDGIQGYVDGDLWTGEIYPMGTFKYTSTIGALKTVRKFTADKVKFKEYLKKLSE